MDGFAVRSADLASGEGRLKITEVITAGMVPSRPVTAGCATRIMTGAPLPEGADAVIKIEEARDRRRTARSSAFHQMAPVELGRHLLRRGSLVKAGARVLPAGRLLRPQEVGSLAGVGRSRLLAHPASDGRYTRHGR